jgi:hypothetical protein
MVEKTGLDMAQEAHMHSNWLTRRYLARVGGLMAVASTALGCAPTPETMRVPPAPVALRLPDPAFLPEIQCHGGYTVAELEQYLPSARVALQLPSTRRVAVDAERRCLTVTVDGIGAGRLAELVLRGVAVPRDAVLLLVAEAERQG